MTADELASAPVPDPGVSEHAIQPALHLLDIEGVEYAWSFDSLTVAQVRELAGWPHEQQVVLVDLETNTETTLEEDKIILLEDRPSFGRKFKFKRGRL